MPRFLFLLAALIPGLAFADASFMPTGSDITVKYFLNSIFGTLVNLGGGADPMSGVISKLNEAILLVGGVLLAYGLIAGTMQTAHDGEVLGKRWSSMWVPIRTSLGISAIVPLGSGYAAIQYVMMWLVLQGVGAANIVWNAYANSADPLAEVAIMQSNGKGAEIADIVLQQQLCTVVINGEIQRAKAEAAARGETNYMVEPYGQIQVDPLGNPTGTTTANSFEKNACGGFDLPAANLAANPLLQSWFGQTFDQTRFSGTMTSGHTSAFNNLSTDMYNLALKIYGGAFASPQTAPALAQQFKTATDKYNKTIGDAARSAMGGTSQTNDVARNAARDGWGMAGAWYMKYVYVQNAINQEVSRYPTVTPPNMEAVPSEFKGALAEFVSRYNAIRKYTSYTNELGVETMIRDDYRANNPIKSAMGATQGAEDSSKFSKYLNEKYGSVLTAPNRYLGQSMVGDKNPVLAAKDFGDYVFTTSTTGTIGMAIVAGFLPTSSMVVVTPLLFALTGALMGFSSILAFYLPIAPYIIWFGVLIGWLVMVVEAVIAAPMWAVAHVHPDGDGIVGRGGQGYSLILGLMLRPALAVVGLIAAMVLIIPVGQLFNRTYWAVFDMSQGNSVQGLFTFAACISIFSVTYLAIINRMFALIHVIPDQILRWMGGPSSDLGSYAGDLGGASSKNAAVVGGVAGGLGGQALSGIQNYKQLRAQQGAKEAQETGNAIAKQNSIAEGEQQYGRGMGSARMAGSDAVRSAMDGRWESIERAYGPEFAQSVRGRMGNPATSDEAIEDLREKATQSAFDRVNGEGAYQSRVDFNDARSKYGLGEASAAEHNKFMKDRERVEMRDKGSFNAETYVQNTLGRQSSSRGASAPPAQPATTPPTDPNAGT
jgi:conjugal transfer/type IV secretion protein DotA/TraY